MIVVDASAAISALLHDGPALRTLTSERVVAPVFSLADRIWELRDNLSAFDAAYVALAEALDIALVTADARIGRASGLRCAVTVVPR